MHNKNFLTVSDGTKIYYRVFGQGKPILFLHGNGGSSRYFTNQARFFKDYYELLFMDSRGHGYSGNESSVLTFEQMTEDLKELLDFLGYKKISILGFSDGANLAMIFAKTYPQMVDKLILNAGNIKFNQTKFISRVFVYVWYFTSLIFSPFSLFFKRGLLNSRLLLKDLNIDEKDLSKFSFKTLVLVGGLDLIKESHSKEIASLIPNSKIVEIKWHGHNVAKTNSKLYNEAVLNFLKEDSD